MINKIRELRAEEIEVRPAHKVKDKIGMLLYIDSRAVTNYLDEWVGCMNWQTEFYEVNGQIIGKLGIWDDNKQMWVWKSDVGSESNIEKEKGLISDTYKRLLSRWGVTYLYTAPDILLEDDGYGNKCYKVSEINYNENKEIIHLVIVNRFGKVVFNWNIGDNTTTPAKPTITPKDNLEWTPDDNLNSGYSSPVQMQPKSNLDKLIEFCATRKSDEGINLGELKRFYNYYSTKDFKGKMNVEQLWERWQKN